MFQLNVPLKLNLLELKLNTTVLKLKHASVLGPSKFEYSFCFTNSKPKAYKDSFKDPFPLRPLFGPIPLSPLLGDIPLRTLLGPFPLRTLLGPIH